MSLFNINRKSICKIYEENLAGRWDRKELPQFNKWHLASYLMITDQISRKQKTIKNINDTKRSFCKKANKLIVKQNKTIVCLP